MNFLPVSKCLRGQRDISLSLLHSAGNSRFRGVGARLHSLQKQLNTSAYHLGIACHGMASWDQLEVWGVPGRHMWNCPNSNWLGWMLQHVGKLSS